MPDREHKLRGSDPRLNEPRKRGDTRILDLKSGQWQWKLGRASGTIAMVFIYSPENKRHEVPLHEVLNISKEDWNKISASEREFPITPKDISDYINETILGRNLVKAA